jgi:hypothetical protein
MRPRLVDTRRVALAYNECAAPGLGSDVGDRLGERPVVAGRVLCRVLPLAVFEVRRLHEDPRAIRPGAFAVSAHVVHAHHHRVRDLTGPRGPALIADVADDHRASAKAELRAVVFADTYPLDKAERIAEPRDCLSHVWIDEDGDDDR